MKTILLGICLMTTMFASAGILKNSGSPDDQTIVLEKTISVSVEGAWQLWTEPRKLASWLSSEANVELKVGGLYELFWEPEHPEQNSTIGCRILELAPNKLISFQWKGPVPFADIMNADPLPTWVRVTFSTNGENQTIIRLEHFGWKSGPHWIEAKKWQKNAWLQAFSQY